VIKNKDLWDISNRPSTKTKLEILEKIFDVWLTSEAQKSVKISLSIPD
jgi:hypothetical protein